MGTGADITSTGAHPQYERCPPAIITGANTYKYSAELAARLMASDGAPAQSDATAHAQSEQSDEPTVPTTTTDTAAPAPRRGRLIDLTGGFGVDFSTMARDFAQAVYVERQPDLCAIARHNLDLLGLGDAQVVNADAASFLATAEDADIIVIDPARRDEHGGRTFAIADCTPDILGMLDLLTARAGHVLVKLSPMLDWHKAVEDCRGTVREVHIVAVANECKELLLVLRGRPDAVPVEDVPVTVHCVNITARGTERFTVAADATGVRSVGTARHSDGVVTGTTNVESANDGETLTGSADGASTGVTAGGTVVENSPTTDADGDPVSHADDGLPFRWLCPKSCAKAVWPVAGSVSVGCLHGVTESGHVQVAAARPIVGGDVSDPGADEHERAPAVGEAADDPGAPADLPVEASESCCSCGSAAGAPGDTRRAARSWSRRYLPSGRRPPLSVSWTPSRGRPPRPWRGRTRVIPWRRPP